MAKPTTDKPSAAQKNTLRAWLVAKGMSNSDAAALVNGKGTNTTRGDIANELTAHLNKLPKKKQP